jgi:exosortase B
MSRTAYPPFRFLDWVRLALPALTLLGLLIPTYHNVAIGLWQNEEHGYAPLLAMLSLGLIIYHARDLHLAPQPGFPVLGAGLFLLGALGYIVGRSQKIELLELAACIPLLAGTLTILGGRDALHRMRFPLFFLIFSLPYPAWVIDSLTNPLKLWISAWAESMLYTLDYPVARSGVVVALGPYRLLVEDACSGLHSLIFLSALGLLYIHLTGPRQTWQRLILVAALIPIAVVANFIRVLILMLITYHFGDAIGQSYWHETAGILLFVSAFAGLYGLDSLLRLIPRHFGRSLRFPTPHQTGIEASRQQEESSIAAPRDEAGRSPSWRWNLRQGFILSMPSWKRSLLVTLALTVTLVLSVLMTPRNLIANTKPLPVLETLIPLSFADWRHDTLTDQLLVIPKLKQATDLHDQVLARTYVNGQGQRVMLFVSYGSNQLGREFQEHRPEFCYRGAGFSLLETGDASLPLAGHNLDVRQLLAQQYDRFEAITYWMTIGDQPTMPGVPRKLVQLRYGLMGEIPDGMLVRVSSLVTHGEDAFALQNRFIADLSHASPQILGFRTATVPSAPN